MKTDREMFVKKYREVFKVDKSLFVNDNGEFIVLFCLFFFVIWQACVPEGYVVVPMETLEEALSWANCASSESWTGEQQDEIDKHCKVIEKAMIEAVEK